MNKPFVLFSLFFAALVVIAFAASALADVVYVPFVKVDVNGYDNNSDKNTSGTLTGYNAANFANATLTNTLNISPELGISVTTTRITTKTNRDRANGNCDALTNDFIFENATGKTVSSTITGLVVGKEYSLTVYSHDTGSGASAASSWTLTQGEGAAVNIGTVTNSQTAHKTTDANTHLTYTFTAEANTVVLTGSIANGLVVLNGLEMTESFDTASGYTRFDINSNHKDGSETRIISPRSTELFVDNVNTSNTATATAPTGITMTVTSDNVLNSRTRNMTNSAVDMNLYNDFVFSESKVPFTTTLENLSADTIYRMTVYALDPSQDQSAGIWTMTNANGEELFKTTHNPTFSDAATWSFTQTFKPGTTSVSMLAELNGKTFTMLNGLELQEINANTSDYTWAAGRASWLADGKWVKKDGTTGTPVAGDVCYVDASGVSSGQNYWLNATADPFNATLVLKGANAQVIIASNITANDLILDGGCLHHGVADKTFALNGKLCVTSDSTIDIDDGSKRTLQIKSTLSGSGNLAINGNGSGNAIVEISNANANGYSGQFLLNKVTLKLSGTESTLGNGALNIPSDSKLSMAGTRRGLLKVPALAGNGPISVDDTSFLALATSDPQTYNGTISVVKDKAIHIGYNDGSDHAANVSLPNATVSLVSNATLGLVHENNSAKVSSFEIGTLNGVAGSIVRASGSINTGSANFATLTVGQGDFAGVIGGSNSSQVKMALVKNTNGTLTLSGANVYAGGTTIDAGKIVLNGAGTLGTGAVTIGENGTLEFAHDTPQTFSNAVSGTGALSKSGSGTLTLSGNNTYTGKTTISAGTLKLSESGTLGTGSVTIGENGTLEFNVAEGSTRKTTISSPITGSGKITKTGAGVLQLFTAAEGLVDAASFVVSSGRLDMKEFFKGTLEIGNGAEFSPGNSVGTLNVDGTFKADAFSTLIFEQDATGMDSLSASSFVIDPNAEIQLDITALIPGATYDVIVNTSADGFTTEQGSESFWTNLLADGLPYYLNLSVVDNHIVRMQIDANAVPEPSTWALLVLGVVVLFLRKRS